MARYRAYDHRVKQMIFESGHPDLFPSLKIPRSTALTWIRRGVQPVVTLPSLDLPVQELAKENESDRQELNAAAAAQKLTHFTFRVFGMQIQYQRLPNEESKTMILTAIKNATKVLTLKTSLQLIGLTAARYHFWVKRQVVCRLEDAKSCPKQQPTRLTIDEIEKIREYAGADRFAHYSVTALSWVAKKAGEFIADSKTTPTPIGSLDLYN